MVILGILTTTDGFKYNFERNSATYLHVRSWKFDNDCLDIF